MTRCPIRNGALELLPDSPSTMVIIPLQMILVYRVGKARTIDAQQVMASLQG